MLQGEEVYNTYGQLANWHLLHMYGFAEEYPKNHYDTVSTAGKLAPTSHVRVCWGVPQEPLWYREYSWQTGTYFTCTGLLRSTPRNTMIPWVQLANWHLLHMYGFAEEYPKNHYDTVSTAGKLASTSHVRVCWGVPQEPLWYSEYSWQTGIYFTCTGLLRSTPRTTMILWVQLANWHLLHMYGFAEEYPKNHYDTVSTAGKLASTSHVRVCRGVPQEPLWYSEYSWQTGTYFTCTGLLRSTPRTTMIQWVQLANWHLLHMYGFAEEYPKNHYDTVSTAGKLAPTSHVRVCRGVPQEPLWYSEYSWQTGIYFTCTGLPRSTQRTTMIQWVEALQYGVFKLYDHYMEIDWWIESLQYGYSNHFSNSYMSSLPL